ncbi:MAG: cyclic pyranopterin monophosphate synthase MoaC [Planctomycetes bacterium]|nr:cyclic pyranopterin monophosphate synthase MoaC [Planctomycetota bacterium]
MSKRIRLTHQRADGSARMVDVSAKRATHRKAVAEAFVQVGTEVAELLAQQGGVAKGNVLETARVAGIQAAKTTPRLIPMCHSLALDFVDVDARLEGDQVHLQASVSCRGATGVEMEAMTAAAVAALTVYDMVKSAGKGVTIGPIRLVSKEGGKSGRWERTE